MLPRIIIASLLLLFALQSAGEAQVPQGANPELDHWFATYTVLRNGVVYRTYTPANRGAAYTELLGIIQRYGYARHVVRVANTGGIGDFRVVYDGFGPGDEAQLLYDWAHHVLPAAAP